MSKRPDPDEPSVTEIEPNGGLMDPRTIHPSPEGLFPDPTDAPGTTPSPESEPVPNPGDEDEGPGIVDPRHETIGPDI